MAKYRYVGLTSETLASGRPVSLGDQVNLTDKEQKDSHNAWLIESGRLHHLKPNPSRTNRGSKKLSSKETNE
jgi:hypothetical protein